MIAVVGSMFFVLMPSVASADGFDLSSLLPMGAGSASGKIIQLVSLLTVLSVAPGLLIMVTSFARFAMALSFCEQVSACKARPPILF